MVDTPSQLITAVEVAAGSAHDGDTALPLVEESEQNTGLEVAETVGDCAYGDDETRRQFAEAERTIIAPVPSPPRTGKFPKTAFCIGRRMASSSRSRARRSGFWEVHPIALSRRQTLLG